MLGPHEAVAIRRAGEEDVTLLRTLWEEYNAEIAELRRAPWSWGWDDVSPRLAQGAAFLAETGDGVVGFAIASRSRPDVGYVEDVYVRPSQRRRGVATALLAHVLGAFAERGVQYVALDVDAGNEPARAMYERLGFVHYADRLAASLGRSAERDR